MIGEGIIEDDLTAFKFRLRKEIGLKGLQKQLERSCILRLFLHNLENIYIDEQCYEYCPVQREKDARGLWADSPYFWSNRGYIPLNAIPCKAESEDDIRTHVEVRFMKKPFLINDSKKSVIPQDGALYVTLPTDISVGGAVYINVPAFETTTNRRDIMVTDATTWNAGIAALVFGKEGVFVKLFNSFTKEYKKTIANYAFLYVPLELYKELYKSFNRFLIISLDVLICRYSPLLRAFPALFISEEPHKSFYYPSCFRSQK